VVPITTGLLVRLGYNALTRIASNALWKKVKEQLIFCV
jgi:hypothetical protein